MNNITMSQSPKAINQRLGFEIAHMCLAEVGYSVVGVWCWEFLRAKLLARRVLSSWLANCMSHMVCYDVRMRVHMVRDGNLKIERPFLATIERARVQIARLHSSENLQKSTLYPIATS